jgi:hypothetical protein
MFDEGEGEGQNLVSPAHQPAGVSATSPDQADRGELLAQQGQRPKAPSRSCTEAAVRTTASTRPKVSTAMRHLLPLIFLPPSNPLLAALTVSAALTDGESIDPAVGSSARPHATRSRPRSRSSSP